MLTMALATERETTQAALRTYSDDRSSVGALDARLASGSVRRLAAREHVCHEGDHRHHVYKIEAGSVCIYKTMPDGRRQIFDFAYPGDVIGLGALDSYVFSAQAIVPTRLRCLPISALYQIAKQDARLGIKLYEAVSLELAAARDLLLTVSQRSATERVAAFLIALSRRNERSGGDPERIVLPMTRADIADYLGLTIETVSRSLTKLRVRKLIELEKSNNLTLRDIEALEELAEGETNNRA